MNELNEQQKQWVERLRAVGRAQGRYLFTLLLFGVFFLAVSMSTAAPDGAEVQPAPQRLSVPMIGVHVDPCLLMAAAPFVLGTILLAVLGTFDAIGVAKKALAQETFERMDTAPNALDFMVYPWTVGPARLPRLGLLIYPLVLTLAYVEACLLLLASRGAVFESPIVWMWPHALFVLVWCAGPLLLVCCLPKLAWLWCRKLRRIWVLWSIRSPVSGSQRHDRRTERRHDGWESEQTPAQEGT